MIANGNVVWHDDVIFVVDNDFWYTSWYTSLFSTNDVIPKSHSCCWSKLAAGGVLEVSIDF
jgi:hypothetical protein